MRNYLEAVEDWPADDVDAAVTAFIKGTVPGFDGKWAPTAPMLAGACRLAAEKRAREAYLDGLRRPALPPPPVEHSPEERARIQAMAKQASELLSSVSSAEDKQREVEVAQRWQRTNQRFAPDMSEKALAERLHLVQDHYWTAGDEGEAA
ncbi:MAG TPA: hypothetical protein VD994_04560 [Prosthecobacter sp.]|nr:hypothetical protein [Prosthecobacter sp.]